MSFLIDTDNVISILRNDKRPYKKSIDYLKKHKRFNISCITYYECLRGYKSINATKKYKLFLDMMNITDIYYLNDKILQKASNIYYFLKPQYGHNINANEEKKI